MAELITGLEVQTQVPLDLKSTVNTLAELTSLGVNNIKAYKYYVGLKIYCIENNNTYIWKEQVVGQTGLLTTGFTYNTNYIVNGYNYNNKTFNFYLINTGGLPYTHSVETVNTPNTSNIISLFKEEVINGLNKIFRFRSIKFVNFSVVVGDTIEVTMPDFPTLDSIGNGTTIKTTIQGSNKIRTIKSSNNSIEVNLLPDGGIDIKQPITSSWLTGDIKEVDCTEQYMNANFDNTGLGINERAGWAICNGQNRTKDRMGRVSVGYKETTYPLGASGGNENVYLNMTNIPPHNHGYTGTQGNGWPDGSGDTFPTHNSYPRSAAIINQGGLNGETQPFSIMQPYIVTLMIQKL